jgi:hypothetical protein
MDILYLSIISSFVVFRWKLNIEETNRDDLGESKLSFG